MMSLYFQINLFLAASWTLFQILPKSRCNYRGIKIIAQTLLVSSLVTLPLLAALPDVSFPNFSPPIKAMQGRAIENDFDPSITVQKVFENASTAIKVAPANINYVPPIWLWLFLLGLGAFVGRRLWAHHQLSVLLRGSLTLHKIGRTSVVISDAIAVPFSAMHMARAFVVLPSDLVPFRRDFRIALRHEIEHHRQRDTFWAVFLEWLICGFYINPIAYLWQRTVLQLQELACDEALINRMGISKQEYGSCLLRVAEMALGRRFMLAGTTSMIPGSKSNGHSFLRRRIKMFSRHERSTAKKAAFIALGTVSSFLLVAAAYVAQAAVRSDNSPNPGRPVFDSRIQSLAEESLRKGVDAHNASGGFAIVADPVRGTVIAAVSLNLGFDDNLKGDWALSYPLAPASALKPLLVAKALQNKVTQLDEMHNCEKGEYAYGQNLFHADDKADRLSTAETLARSNNICMIKIGQELGAKGIETALRDFGLGRGGSVKDFPAARVGNIPETKVTSAENYIGFISLGTPGRTNLFVTPLEMVQAYGAIANGGRLMKPIGADGKQSPDMIRDVISPEVSKQMRDVLRKVVEHGTGQRINGSSIALAGKTSTFVNGNKRITGFIGFAPADHPKLVVYVAMFDPKGSDMAGSNTAAPVFRDIIERTNPIFNP